MPGLLGAGRGLRPRGRAHARRAAGDVFVVNGQKVWSSFAHIADYCILVTQQRPRRAALPQPHVPDRRHARARRRGAAAAADHGRGGVQRDLLQRRRGARLEPARRRGRGLAGRDDDAAARARHARLRAHRCARGRRRPADRPRARARRTATRGARERVAHRVDRAAGAPLHELPLARHLPAHRHPRPRGLRDQAALVGAEPAADEARPRAARRGGDPRRRLVAPPAAAEPRQHDRGRHLRGAAQHRLRARARAPEEEAADGLRAHRGAAGAEAAGARVARRAVSPRPRLRRTQDDRWGELAELGWLGVSVREDEGGAGLGFVEEAILLEELGYALYPGPYLATVGFALAALGPEERAAVAAGEAKWSAEVNHLVALALVGRPGGRHGRERAARARRGARLRRPVAAARPPRAHERQPAPRAARHRARPHRDGRRGARRRPARPRARGRARVDAAAVRQADRRLSGRLAPAREHVRRRRARALAHLLGGVVRRRGRRAGAGRSRRGQGVHRRSRRRRVRALDPGARRHGLHLGASAPPLLQARALARRLRLAASRAPRSKSRTPCSAPSVPV